MAENGKLKKQSISLREHGSVVCMFCKVNIAGCSDANAGPAGSSSLCWCFLISFIFGFKYTLFYTVQCIGPCCLRVSLPPARLIDGGTVDSICLLLFCLACLLIWSSVVTLRGIWREMCVFFNEEPASTSSDTHSADKCFYELDINLKWEIQHVLHGGKHASTESLYPGYWLVITNWILIWNGKVSVRN